MLIFRPKQLKNHTLWGCTYLYRPYKGIPPGGFLATVERFFRKFLYFDCCVTPVLIFRVRIPTCFTSKHEKLERWLDLIILKCHPTYINQLRMYLLVGSLNSFAIVYRLQVSYKVRKYYCLSAFPLHGKSKQNHFWGKNWK